MDTNIDNYSIGEIIKALKLDESEIDNKEKVLQKTESMVKRIKESESLNVETRNDYIAFFWKCFQKLNTFDRAPRYEISKPELYPGSITKPEPEIVAVNTHNSHYVRGDVNPLKRDTKKNTLIVSSKFSTAKTSTDFSVTLQEPINNAVTLKVAAMEIVNFYYNISRTYKNTYFHVETFVRNKTTGEISDDYRKKIEIADGSYDLQKFITVIETIFNSDDKLSMLEFIYDELKGKLYFSLKDELPVPPPDNSEYIFNIDFSTECEIPFVCIGWLLGYRKQFYTYQKDFVSEDRKTINENIGYNPEMAVDFTGTKFFLLEVTDFNNNSPKVLIYNTLHNSSDILAKIQHVSGITTIIYDDSSDNVFKSRNYYGPVKLQKLKIRLLDEYGKVIDINNADISITFEIETLDIPYKNMVY